MTPRIDAALRSAGWSEDRSIPVETWVEQLTREGYTFSALAMQTLKSYGGLQIIPGSDPNDLYRAGEIRFDPALAALGEFDRIEYWERKLNTKLSPIAETNPVSIVVLAQDGRVFACQDQTLCLLGSTLEDAMDNTLLAGKRFPIEYGRMTE